MLRQNCALCFVYEKGGVEENGKTFDVVTGIFSRSYCLAE